MAQRTALAPASAPSAPIPAHGDEPYAMTWGPPIKYVEIPAGQRGTEATIDAMKKLVLGPWGHRNPEVIWLARKIATGVARRFGRK